MITQHDLDTAIAECQGKQNPDSKTCIMLAAFYTIKREMFGDAEKIQHPAQSFAPAPVRNTIEIDSGSEFARVIDGRDLEEVFPVLDELMDALQVIQPRLYNAVIAKLS